MQILFFTMPISGTPQLDLAPPRGDDDDIDRAIGGRRRRPQHLPFNTSMPLLLKLLSFFAATAGNSIVQSISTNMRKINLPETSKYPMRHFQIAGAAYPRLALIYQTAYCMPEGWLHN